MRTESETIKEATETVVFIRRLQAEEAEIKDQLKAKRAEVESATDHLTALFESEVNDDDRPLLDRQGDSDDDQSKNDDPDTVTFTASDFAKVKELGEQLRGPVGAHPRGRRKNKA